jgi:RecJ-like exonuclease
MPALLQQQYLHGEEVTCPHCLGAGELEIAPERTKHGIAYMRCLSCNGRGELDECPRCNERVADTPLYDPWGREYDRWCHECWDNYEPDDPDGEAFRGGEASSFEAETQARIQRELK